MKNYRFRWSGIIGLIVILSAQSPARFAQPSLLPIEQLLKTVESRLKTNPDDAKAHYTKGRIHYLAFYNMAASVSAFSNREPLPSITPYWTAEANYAHQARRSEATTRALKKMKAKTSADIPREKQREFWQEVSKQTQELVRLEWRPPAISNEEAVEHAEKAMAAFDRAIRLDRADALNILSRASLLEQFAAFAEEKKPVSIPESLSDISPEKIREAYHNAWTVGLDKALELKTKPISGLRSIVSYEAGQAFVRLCEASKELPRADEAKAEKVSESLAKLDALRRGAITPIVFSMDPNAELDDLLSVKSTVDFDLDGDGTKEAWPWVKPDTGFLVWDPGRRGLIQSGRQLFGSYTFQIPWNHGYEPLALMDTNTNGELSGAELDGIRVWFDRDGNGESSSGEVSDLIEHGITTIGLRVSDDVGVVFCEDGLRKTDGTALATWDWMPSPSTAGATSPESVRDSSQQ